MQEVEERSGGVWRPSPGSVYPALAQLEDEGLIRSQETDGRKLLHLTDAGRELLAQRGEDKPAPWEQMSGDVGEQTSAARSPDARGRLRLRPGDAQRQRVAAHRRARGADTARRELYRILADGRRLAA